MIENIHIHEDIPIYISLTEKGKLIMAILDGEEITDSMDNILKAV